MEEELCATPEGAIRAFQERSQVSNQMISFKIIEGYRFYRVHDVEQNEVQD